MVNNPAEADLVLVNTCTVTTEAASDSRQKIRQASRAGKADIAVTGCWSTLEEQAAANLPGVRWVIPNRRKNELVSTILGEKPEEMDLEPLARQPLPGLHMRTRAFIKAQDGCDNHCTYCITRLARGKGSSESEHNVIADVLAAQAGGAREVVLSGVHLGSWGQDFNLPRRLADLIGLILDQTNIERLRLSSLEPWDINQDLLRLWSNPRLCRHLHIPLQSGCASTLRRMARRTTPQDFERLVKESRQAAPDMAITTDIIVGFPGETDQEFEESLVFVTRMEFAAGHVFTYSPRPGTPAAGYPDQIHPSIRKERSRSMRIAIADSSRKFRQNFLSRQLEVLWESASALEAEGWRMEGLTGNYQRVTALSKEKLWNQISLVEINTLTSDGLSGEITSTLT